MSASVSGLFSHYLLWSSIEFYGQFLLLSDGTDESLIYMRLLKLCFNSVNMPGTENEHVMKVCYIEIFYRKPYNVVQHKYAIQSIWIHMIICVDLASQ